MPAGYVIAQLRVTNPENYKEYIEKVNPIVKKFDEAEYIEIDQDILCKNLLRKDDLDDSRITIDYYKLSNNAQLDYLNKKLGWLLWVVNY